MRRDNLLAVANTDDPALARLHELHRVKARTERAYRKAFAEERDEVMRLMMLSDGPGTVAIAESIGITREALRQTFNRWRAGQGHAPTPSD